MTTPTVPLIVLPADLTTYALAQVGGDGSPPPTLPASPPPAGGTPGQPNAASGTGQPVGGTPPSPFGNSFLFMLFAIMAFFLIVSLFSGRKEKKKRAELLASISKGDEVETIGGVIGTVMQVKGDEVLLKVDENANTKIRFRRSAVQTVRDAKARPAAQDHDDDAADADDTKD